MRSKKIKVKAYCPYEIGDKVQFEKGGNVKTMEITDVITETVKNRRKVPNKGTRKEVTKWHLTLKIF